MFDIRLLTAPEVPLLLPLAREFFSEGNLPGKLNELHSVSVLRTHIEKGTGFALAAGFPIRGMISGIMFQDMATAEFCCMEFFWYVSQEERGSLGVRLLSAWEDQAIKMGAVRLLMAHLHSPETEKFTKMYDRRGYRMREQIFVKEVVK